MILFNWFAPGLIPLLMLIVMQVRRMAHRTPILSYCLVACSAGGPAIFLVADLFWLLAAFQPARDPQLTVMFNDLAWMTFTTAVPFLIAQSLFMPWRSTWTAPTARCSGGGWPFSTSRSPPRWCPPPSPASH